MHQMHQRVFCLWGADAVLASQAVHHTQGHTCHQLFHQLIHPPHTASTACLPSRKPFSASALPMCLFLGSNCSTCFYLWHTHTQGIIHAYPHSLHLIQRPFHLHNSLCSHQWPIEDVTATSVSSLHSLHSLQSPTSIVISTSSESLLPKLDLASYLCLRRAGNSGVWQGVPVLCGRLCRLHHGWRCAQMGVLHWGSAPPS